jgi:alkylation response protein AidB-like acyl-CoA dehydrogenase
MDLSPNETQRMVQTAARDFATRVIRPVAAAIDREGSIPDAVLRGLAELGLMSVNVPTELGGAGAGPVAYALAMQEKWGIPGWRVCALRA